ncbi:amidohydrolase family protein [uncultured Cohaesibacter sp.]|uniref:amidohydrolase family protein n=1 Tax=uncultured Cohaesibacter sp. TaxID=1002546 RepID=UPI00292E702A|nr:amidohydrolase family protein [uncultured Cohaesibacter sp.]
MINRKLTGEKPKMTLPAGAIDTQMHMYLPGFPAMPGGPGLPLDPLPDDDAYRSLMQWIGIDRVVITQGNAHQKDNANLVACLKEMGPNVSRGVAVISGQTPAAELKTLADAGVTAARIMDLPGGAIGLDALEEVDAICLDMGWAMAVQFNGSDLSTHYDRLAALRSNWILDHHGKFFRGLLPEDPEVTLVRKLIDKGNCYYKFAGCYESSLKGGPDYADIAAIARVIASHAPERLIWGTNWPHNMAQKEEDYPDDALLLDTVLGWLPDEQSLQLALVDNPERLFAFEPWDQAR